MQQHYVLNFQYLPLPKRLCNTLLVCLSVTVSNFTWQLLIGLDLHENFYRRSIFGQSYHNKQVPVPVPVPVVQVPVPNLQVLCINYRHSVSLQLHKVKVVVSFIFKKRTVRTNELQSQGVVKSVTTIIFFFWFWLASCYTCSISTT